MTTRREWTLTLPYLVPPLTLNHSHHWTKTRVIRIGIRDAACWLAKAAKIPKLTAVTLELVYHPRDSIRRDADNMAATMKPAIDGLVLAGVLDDDNAKHVLSTTQRVGDRRSQPKLLLIVRGTEAAHADREAAPH